ncbi:hypothetical protein COLO4_05004 [Corchorus olitorius]|uniref:Uncharacterized protein n=1 Tax=Corchorus olitorius TaxID=93759 RepID=A0A1R3KS74_9ROSI|nr:hypothetical protein COLO4_05004 [Corchorus olitorius]
MATLSSSHTLAIVHTNFAGKLNWQHKEALNSIYEGLTFEELLSLLPKLVPYESHCFFWFNFEDKVVVKGNEMIRAQPSVMSFGPTIELTSQGQTSPPEASSHNQIKRAMKKPQVVMLGLVSFFNFLLNCRHHHSTEIPSTAPELRSPSECHQILQIPSSRASESESSLPFFKNNEKSPQMELHHDQLPISDLENPTVG